MSTDFENVFCGLNPAPGKLRLAAGGIGWKQNEGGDKPVTVPADQMRHGEWIRVARNFQLKLHLSRGDKDTVSFDGFARDDYERVVNLFKNNYSIPVDTKETSLRGWNWGKADVTGSDLAFSVGGKTAWTIPIEQIHNTTINKTEVILEFNQPDVGGGVKKKQLPDEMVEMRVFIPGSESRARKKAKKAERQAEKQGKAKKEDDQEEEEVDTDDVSSDEGEGIEDGTTAAQVFHDTIKDRADIGKIQGDSIMSFNEVHHVTPRGKYEVELYNGFLRVRNKSYDYKILFTSIKRLFLLPKNDEINIQLAINLDPGLRQGQTKYSYIVMQFPRDEHMEAEPNLDDATVKETYPELAEKYDDPAYTVMSNVLRAVSGKRILSPSPNFSTKNGQTAVKCNLRANEGQLYFMEKSMLFLSRQPILIPYNDIATAYFERIAGAMVTSRTVDLRLERQSDSNITFSALVKDEHPLIQEFLESKSVKVSNQVMDDMMGTSQAVAAAMMDVDSDDGDDSDNSAAEERKQAAKGGAKGNINQMNMEDEDSEVDEDFKANSDESDVGEEYDEKYSSSEAGSSDEEEKPPKKKSKKDE